MSYNNTNLSTINSGNLYNKFLKYPKSVSIKDTITTGFKENDLLKPEIVLKSTPRKDSIKDIVNTGFEETECKKTVEDNKIILESTPKKELFPESIKDTVDTGFSTNNLLEIECKKPTLVTYLIKENYLSEFAKETEKLLARYNLGVYSKQEVELLTKNLLDTIDHLYVPRETMETRIQETLLEVNNIIKGIEYVDSTLKSRVNYSIPEALFIL